jgi:small-conductance mechanosensitive channel
MLIDIIKSTFGMQMTSTAISAFVIVACVTVLYYLFKNKFYTERKRRQFKLRMTYLGVLIFLLVLTRIWVNGFTHIFTMLSLIAAGLVVTNKESIMNFAGWLIINWRGVFSEGDYIQIQGFTGCIDSINTFHFKVIESTSVDAGIFTGRTIKVPNSLIITTPFILFTPERHCLFQCYSFQIPETANAFEIMKQIEDYTKALWEDKYTDSKHFKNFLSKSKYAYQGNSYAFNPVCQMKLASDKLFVVIISVTFYCQPDHIAYFQDKINKEFIALSLPLVKQ